MERSIGPYAVEGSGGSAQDVVANTVASSWGLLLNRGASLYGKLFFFL